MPAPESWEERGRRTTCQLPWHSTTSRLRVRRGGRQTSSQPRSKRSVCHGSILASVALLIVAFVVDLVKRDDAVGTWQQSHFSWRIRSVLWAAGLYLLTAPLWLLFLVPGWIAWGVISIWFLYRVVRGWMKLNANLPMPQ